MFRPGLTSEGNAWWLPVVVSGAVPMCGLFVAADVSGIQTIFR